MEFVQDNPVLSLTMLFIAVSLLFKVLMERITFALKSNFKYKILDALANFIYYGPDIGVKASLSLDGPSKQVLERRLKGQEYLQSKLGGGHDNIRGQDLTKKLVDCRFSLLKVLMPIMRELEFSPTRNLITQVQTDGMHQVVVDSGIKDKPLVYCGNDAVHTLGVSSFHAPIQQEINRRMELGGGDSALRFAPITLNPELEKNANLILRMTGMDQVGSDYDNLY
jgi:hypothetical protein